LSSAVIALLLRLFGPSTRALLAADGAYRGLLHAEYLVENKIKGITPPKLCPTDRY
jgi:hypothetical protein